MQSKLEITAITKRNADQVNLTYDETKEYGESVAKKSPKLGGITYDNPNSLDVLTASGGSDVDINGDQISLPNSGRNKNIAFNKYNSTTIYSDVDNCMIDTTKNVGQYKVK